ncbi:hypothetical protein ACI2L4_24995 [Streptomyces sparsogenes]|uniref:hypothetical protein n=1 Tax=Streptomyces sparsogenes TaxID=67365 RepID=UPI00384DE48D
MEDGAAIPADEANEWLKKRFTDDPHPRIDITWYPAESDDDAYHRLLRILFSAPPDDLAA